MTQRIVLTLTLLVSLTLTFGMVYAFGTLRLENAWVNSGVSWASWNTRDIDFDVLYPILNPTKSNQWGKKTAIPLSTIHKEYAALPFLTDVSIYRFVSRDTPLVDKEYEPDDLESISWAHINTAGRSSLKLRKVARDALSYMAADFEAKFGVPLTVISSYRSAKYQQRMWDLGKCSDSLCAPPGSSEHQLGLAMDLFDATTEKEYLENFNYRRYISWLQQNAHLYGWHQSYQKGESIDNYEVEPWHWRYLGVDLATKLHNLGWTYTEYVRFQIMLSKR